MKVDFPALGSPSRPTSASTFSSSLRARCSPGSPGVALRGARLVLDLKLTLPRPPLPPRASNATCSCTARSATVSPVSAFVITMPSPPLPAWTSMRASSTNFMVPVETKKPYRVDRAFGNSSLFLSRDHADRLFVVRALEAELDLAVHLCEKGMVLPDPDVVPGVNAGTALANDDAARGYDLPAVALDAETL